MERHENLVWLNSKETRKLLKINGCQLMHLRETGFIAFKKIGNAFFYSFQEDTARKLLSSKLTEQHTPK